MDPSCSKDDDEENLSFLQDALNEECSNQVRKLIASKMLNGETVSVIRAFEVCDYSVIVHCCAWQTKLPFP